MSIGFKVKLNGCERGNGLYFPLMIIRTLIHLENENLFSMADLFPGQPSMELSAITLHELLRIDINDNG